MGYRVVNWDSLLALGWIFLASFHLLINNTTYHVPLIFLIPAVVSGVIFGVFFYGEWALKILRVIEKKGVYTVSLITWLYLAGAALIFIGLFTWVFNTLPLQSSVVILDFCYPMLPAALLTRALLYLRWERKNKRLIYTTWGFSGKVYAYPYIYNAT